MHGTEAPAAPSTRRCAIYTRKSSQEGLEQSFNSLHAQREACEAYIKSQTHEGWKLRKTAYDDGGISGGHMDRPGLTRLLRDVRNGLIDIVLVYKVDRLSRSLADFARLIDLFDEHDVSFVSVTQQFNTSSSMGRLTLNVLLSFAQFELEVTGERIRDKIALSRRKGMWTGGTVPLGYDVREKQLHVNEAEAETVRHIYGRYIALGCVRKLKEELDSQGCVSKLRPNGTGGKPFSRGALYALLRNPLYTGRVAHKGRTFEGRHDAIVNPELWQKVQDRLKANRSQAKARSASKSPSLLAGLLFDDRGNPMSPTHATKNNRRYRYYISQAVLKFEKRREGSVLRVPANTVEALCVAHIRKYLTDAHEFLTSIREMELNARLQDFLVQEARRYACEWGALSTTEQIDHLHQFVKRIELCRTAIRIEIRTDKLSRLLLPDSPDRQTAEQCGEAIHVLSCPALLKRSGVETRFVTSGNSEEIPHLDSLRAIQKAVSNALRWNQILLDGKAANLTQLATQENVQQRYVCSLIKLACLSPEIIRQILNGQAPSDLTLGRLQRSIPLDWSTQRRTLGF